eukprot:343007_1
MKEYCPKPPSPWGIAALTYSDLRLGTPVHYQCINEYVLQKDGIVVDTFDDTCEFESNSRGKWSGATLSCVEACTKGTLEGGTVKYNYPDETFKCNELGHKPNVEQRRCTNGQWDPDIQPVCTHVGAYCEQSVKPNYHTINSKTSGVVRISLKEKFTFECSDGYSFQKFRSGAETRRCVLDKNTGFGR